MTFTEAAIEVLRLTGRPLHYKKITELAIQKNLLSHVGKTPEVTMSSRLATLVKKESGDSLIIKVKPGVFGLRDFGQEVIAAAAVEIPDDPLAAAAEEVGIEVEVDDDAVVGAPSIAPAAVATGDAPAVAASIRPKGKPLPGSDVFPEEEDDDEPILASLDKEKEGDDARGGGADGRGRRRRRRRRGGGEGDVREEKAFPDRQPTERVAVDGERSHEERPAREPRNDRPEREPRNDRDRNDRNDRDRGGDRDRNDRDRDRQDRMAPRSDAREEFARANPNREAADGELAGKDLADAVFAVMQTGDRNPQTFSRISEWLVRRGRLQGDSAALVPTVAAAVRADMARREAEDVRPRFRIVSGRVLLTDWSLSNEAIRFEQDAVRAADRQRDQVRQAFLRRVRELPGAGFAELLATWLNAEGVVSLRAVRRPGAQPGELHLAGTLKRGHDELRLAIVARRDGREIGRERVIEMRGALHYYGSASAAWLITTGPVLSGAREEAAVAGVAPCSLFDGTGIARAMERTGVGLRRHSIPVATLDLELLESLRGIDPLSNEERAAKARAERDAERDAERERRHRARQEQGEGGAKSDDSSDASDGADENQPSETTSESGDQHAPHTHADGTSHEHHDGAEHEHNHTESEDDDEVIAPAQPVDPDSASDDEDVEEIEDFDDSDAPDADADENE